MPDNYDYDLIAIGGGSAGATAAMGAVGFGKKVLVIEKGFLGGTCTNVGCVPSKSYLHAADLIRSCKQASESNLFKKSTSGINFAPIKDHKEQLIKQMRETGEQAVKRAGIEVLKGKARLAGPNSVSVNGKEISAEKILIAAGTAPFIPPIEGLSEVPYLTSTGALELDYLPKSIIIVGGSYIGLEFATFYNSLGVKTFVIEVVERLAKNEDEEMSAFLTNSLINQGIEVATSAKILQVGQKDKEIFLEAEHKGEKKTFSADKILIATGRVADFKGFNLESAGVKYSRKGIEVNEYLQTSVPSIYAAGDVLPSFQLEHVAVHEGWIASKNMFSAKKEPMDYRVIPRVMFSYPEVASVGETEGQAKTRTNAVSATYSYKGIALAKIAEQTDGLIKLVAQASTGELLGAHIVGADAGNLVHLGALVMQYKTDIRQISSAISAYPTLAKGFYHAADKIASELLLAA